MSSVARFTGVEVIEPPKFEPVSLTELKLSLRFGDCDTADDALLSALISAARDSAENFQRRSIVESKYRMYLNGFMNVISPVFPNLLSVDAIYYLDSAGETQLLDTSVYDVDTASQPGRITIAYGQAWPSTQSVTNSVWIEYTAGYAKVAGTLNEDWASDSKTIKIDIDESIPPSGVIYVANAAGEFEAIGYRVIASSASGYTLSLPKFPAYTFLAADDIEVHFIPESTRQAIIAIASDVYEHPGAQLEVSVSSNKIAEMLLRVERVMELY